MKVCIDCFKDQEIKTRIKALHVKGNCDIHKNEKNTWIYDTEKNDDLVDDFTALVELYSTDPDKKFVSSPKESKLSSLLKSQWDIFNISSEHIHSFIKELLQNKYMEQPDIFNELVLIPELEDSDIIRDKSIFGEHDWQDFCEDIKYHNRFFTNYLDAEKLLRFLEWTKLKLPKRSIFYRARVTENQTKIKPIEMKIPPKSVANSGRLNSAGIGSLYLASSSELTVKEIRAAFQDEVVIATCHLKDSIEIVDLTSLDNISPFRSQDQDSDFFIDYQVNRSILKNIAENMIRPSNTINSKFDYLPTQYISDVIKSKYDGIKYKSTMTSTDSSEYNLVLFNDDRIRISKKDLKREKIASVKYDTKVML